MKKIKLNKGLFTKIDDQDYNLVSKKKWFVSSNGYVVGNFRNKGKNKTILLSRYLLDPPKGLTVDHINRDKLDNRRINLRTVTQSINSHNQKLKVDNTSGYKGVSYIKELGKWVARIRMNYKRIHLGLFDSPEKASNAYIKAERSYCE